MRRSYIAAAAVAGTFSAPAAHSQPEFEAVVVWQRQGLPGLSQAVFAPDGARVLINGSNDPMPSFDPVTLEQDGSFAGGWVVIAVHRAVVRLRDGTIDRFSYPAGEKERSVALGEYVERVDADREGREVAYARYPDERGWINLEGQRLRWVTTGALTRTVVMHPRGERALFIPNDKSSIDCMDASGALLWRIPGANVINAEFDETGSLILTGHADGAQVLDSSTGAVLDTWPEVCGRAAWSPDGRRVAAAQSAASGEPVICRVWTLPGRTLVEERLVFALGIDHLNWSPDGARLLATGSDSFSFIYGLAPMVRTWVAGDGTPAVDLPGQILGDLIEVSPDGRTLMSAGHDSRVNIYDASSGRPRGLFAVRDIAWSAAASPTENRFFVGTGIPGYSSSDGEIDAFDGAALAWTAVLRGTGVGSLRVSPDGALIASFEDAAYTAYGAIVRDARTGEALTDHLNYGWALDWVGPDRIVVIQQPPFYGADPTPRVIEVPSGTEVGTWTKSLLSIERLRRSPDGQFMLGNGWKDEEPGVMVWDTATGELVTEFTTGGALPREWSADGHFAAGGTDEGDVAFFEMPSGRQIATLRVAVGSPGKPEVIFFPDGLRLALLRPDGWTAVVMNPLACRADCNQDGRVDAADLVCFQSAWRTRQPLGDFDLNGAYNVRDFTAFSADWSRASAGLCP